MSNLPDWPGADAVSLHPAQSPTRIRALIDALNKGDEETIKGLLLQTHVYH
jgi:hypothetical protein